MEVFDNLGIVEVDVKETYLTTFLACWLCKFVLPLRGVNLIRLGVFKIASRMAQCETFSLVVSVLASIYNDLNKLLVLQNLGLMHLFSLFITYTNA